MKKLMKTLLALSMVAVLGLGLVGCGGKDAGAAKLEKLNWAENNYKAIENMISDYGKDGKLREENKKPYAVFDWDNTSIMNDVEEALLVYQIEHLAFKMTPEEMDRVLKNNIPKDNFSEKARNEAGQEINIDMISEDIIKDYTALYNSYEGMKGDKSLDDIHKMDEYMDFRAKLRFLYYAIGESFSPDVSYPWVTYLFTGMTSDEVAKLTDESNDYWLKQDLKRETWTSPENMAGKAGVVKVEFERGIRTVEEMQNLYKTLMANGIDVYICSASYIDVVQEFASNPKFGYEIPKDHVYAMVLTKDKDGVIQDKMDPEYFQTQGQGKVETINKFIKPKQDNSEPIMVGGDSNGDYEMLSAYPGTKISLIINRVKGGDKIGKLSKEAADTAGQKDERYFLQGRDNNTGKFLPSEKSILLGEKDEKLLKEE